jgi:aryl-alcohol dehydrogenase-like predicted oxidoreductase
MMKTNIDLGLGLIGIGRPWGHTNPTVPDEKEVTEFLAFAHNLGITYYDTAPSYGLSEERLGKFLQTLSDTERKKLCIATKFGEHWDKEKNITYVDHSFSALKKSLDNSLQLLLQIDLLFLHKSSLSVLQSPEVLESFAYAKTLGIQKFGASVSDLESAEYVLTHDLYSYIQFPYNMGNTTFESIIKKAKNLGKTVVINRPFNMGNLLHEGESNNTTDFKQQAYSFILQQHFNGYILTGTKTREHLEENYKLFQAAKKQ